MKPIRWRRVGAGVAGGLAVVLAVLGWPMDTDHYLQPAASGELLDRHGEMLGASLGTDENWTFVRSLGEFSPHLVRATMAAEDQRFDRHVGVDPLAVGRAIGQWARWRRPVSGASTITMQVIKMGDGGRRSLPAKAHQALQAVRLELRKSKPAIMAAYLNRAPYGSNLLGAEAASLRYFGKPARQLSPAEAALLAALPNAPTRLNPLRNPQPARVRRDWILDRMLEMGDLTDTQHRQATRTLVEVERHPFPEDAPHLMARRARTLARGGAIHTTLDRDLQRRAQEALVETLAPTSINSGAVMVLDATTGEFLVRIGSPDFHALPAGQYDGCTARRSPGSALKPFTYGLGFEHGVFYPGELIDDEPLDFGSFVPRNFDREHRGPQPVAYTLAKSLNIPAAIVLDRVGPQRLLDLLRECSLTTLHRSAEEYGLGLTLGGCEVRLDEMMAAYGAIANLGELRPPRIDRKAPPAAPRRVLSRDACLALFAALEQPLPGELARDLGATVTTGSRERAAWKTGTSTGYRDAWAFVFDGRYVVGVWMGNSDGIGSVHLVGASMALPLATRVFRMLPAAPGREWATASALSQRPHLVEVCATSGLVATRWCTVVQPHAIPGDPSRHRHCTTHTPQGAAAAPSPLRILQPAPGSRFVAMPGGNRLPLRAAGGSEGTRQHWYLGEHYLGASDADTPLILELRPGNHHLAVLDESGTTAKAEFTVE